MVRDGRGEHAPHVEGEALRFRPSKIRGGILPVNAINGCRIKVVLLKNVRVQAKQGELALTQRQLAKGSLWLEFEVDCCG